MLINLGLGFVSFPILTRVFSVADFGLIDLVQKIFLLLTATSKLGQQNSALRFFNRETFEKDPEQSRRYYSTMYLGVMGMGIGVTALFAAVVWALPATMLMPSLSSLLLFASALILLRAVQSIVWSFLRIKERTGLYNVANVNIVDGDGCSGWQSDGTSRESNRTGASRKGNVAGRHPRADRNGPRGETCSRETEVYGVRRGGRDGAESRSSRVARTPPRRRVAGGRRRPSAGRRPEAGSCPVVIPIISRRHEPAFEFFDDSHQRRRLLRVHRANRTREQGTNEVRKRHALSP